MKSYMELFSITQQEIKSTRIYLKRFNKEMFKVEELLELVTLKALIREVREHAIRRKLYALLDKSLLKLKQVMENHIWVEEVDLLWHEPQYFFFTKTTSIRDLPNKIILVVEMETQERTMKDQPMGI